MRRRWPWIALAVVVGAFVVIEGGTFVYIHFIESDPPPRLTLDAGSSSAPVTGGRDLSGTWVPSTGSTFGYRVHENLHGQDNEAAGRTSAVSGSMVISGTTVQSVALTVPLADVSSDDNRRDQQFRGRVMSVSRFPDATFTLTQPIALPAIPEDASVVTVQATGDLTLHGTTRPVTVALDAQRDGADIKVQGTIPVTFADYGIPSPSFVDITVDDHGEIELLVVFARR